VSASRPRCCAICGSTKDIQEHHLGGRQHAAYFTIPLCVPHHQEVSIAIQRADAEMMRYTSDRTERLIRIVMACSVLQWYACQQLQVQRKPNRKLGENK
jgi:hypothetical protein